MKQINKMKTSLVTLALLLVTGLSVKAQLNGTYTVYGAGANYADLQAAAAALSAGVSGPVTFKIRPGNWTSATTSVASLGAVSGASATNTITFEAENGDAATTIITNTTASTSTTDNLIFYFNGAKYIRVRNLTMNKTASSYGTVLRYAGDADYNIVENCVLTGVTTTSTSTNMARVYLTSGASANNNIIRNNTINYGSVGIYWYGTSSSSLSSDNEFSGNKIVDAYNYGIYTYYTSGQKINDNTITRGAAGGSYYGISAIYANNGFEIDGNTVSATGGTSTNYGIYLSSSNISNTNRGFITDNVISISSSSTQYALYATSSNYFTIGGNTITSTGTTTNSLYALYNYNTSTTYGKDVYVNGNTITATGTGTKYAYGHYTATNGQFNNNKITLGAASSNGACYVYAGYSSCNNTEALDNDIALYSANSVAVLYSFYSSNVNCRFNGNKYARNVYSSTSTHYTYLFYSSNQNGQILDNEFSLLSTSTATQYFYAFYSGNTNNVEFSGNDLTITSNSGTRYNYIGYSNTGNTGFNRFNENNIQLTASSGTMYHYMGYQCYVTTVGNEVKDNVIKMNAGSGSAYNYSAYYMDGGIVTGNDCDVRGAAAYGFMVYGYSSGSRPWTIKNNKVVAIGTSTVYGLYTAYCSNADISNNSVAAISTSGTVYGFYPSYNNGGADVYNNTIYTQSSGTQYTVYSYQSSGSQFVRYRNNVIARSGGTSGYLMYHYQPQFYEWDYNNYWFGGANIYFGGTGASYGNVTALRAGMPGQNMNSLTYDPGFMSASTGDVRPNPANANSWSVNGRGVQISGNDKDINGNARAVTTLQGVPDLGAYEFTPTSTPPDCAMAPAAPPANGTQVVTFGQDTVAVLRWGATVPTGFAVKQYTGTNPPNITTINPTQMFYYVDFQGTGSALGYEQDLYFKDPWLGSIASKSALRLAEKVGANNWSGYAPGTSISNIVRNFIATPSVNDVGALFTGIDVANNASADAIIEPASPFCPGTYLVKLRIKNQGNNIINNVKIDWQQDGGIINTITYTTPININGQGNEAIIPLANITFGSAPVRIKAWTYLPNGVNDPVAIDDTLDKDYFAALSGTYTVGGTSPHFPTVVAAAKALEDYGTCGNVVFNIRPGTYTGKVVINDPIRLSSATDRVTFQAENGNASSVSIDYSATGTYDPTIQWNGVDNLTLRNLTINANGVTYGVGIVMSGVCNDDSIIGCNINVSSTVITSANMGIYAYYNNGFTCNNLTVRKSKIVGGYYGAYMYGTSNLYQNNVTFDSCELSAFYYALMCYYHNSPKITDNKMFGRIVGTYTGYMGLYAYYCRQSPVITGNRISGFYYYGLYSYYFSGNSSSDKGLIRNNTIVMDATKTSYYSMYFYAPNQLDMINNTVINNGLSSSGNYTVYMYLSPSTSYQNNALINNVFAHTTGGTPINIYFPSGYGNQMDYNNIYSSDPAKFSAYSGYSATSLDGWRTITNQDLHSVSYDPAMKSNTNPEPDMSNNASWALNGHGVHIVGNDKDINGNVRPETRPAGVPDIGAFEITPDVIPPVATGVPATAGPGDLQVFSFAGNEVGRIQWGTKAPAAAVEVRQYSGERESGIAAAAAPKGSMYFYTDIKPLSSASTYDFDFNLDYMETWLGDIPNDADLRLAHRVTGYPWMVYSGSLSSVTPASDNIDATALNRFGKFSALENNSVASAFVRTSGSTVICIGNSVQLDAEPQNGDNYKWYRNGVAIPGADGPNVKSYTANQAGDYSVAITFGGSSGNKIVESVPATVSTIAAPNAVVVSNKQLTYCVGNGLTLNAGTVPGVTYQWQLNGTDIAGATGNTHAVGQAGNYTVVVSNIGCSTVSAVTPVTSGPLNVTLGNDTSYCEVKNVFHKLDAGYPGAKYLWSTGDTTREIEVRQSGTYKVTVNGGINCVDDDEIIITIDPLPSAQGISFVQNGNSYQFFPSGAIGATGFMWMFSDGSVSTQQNPTKEIKGELYVRLVMYNACGSDTVQLGWPLGVSAVSEESSLNVYPNPAKDKVTISMTGSYMKEVEVLSSVGSVVYRGVVSGTASHSVDVSGLANGHYMLRAVTSEGVVVTKQFDVVR